MNLRGHSPALDDVVQAFVQPLADEAGKRFPIERVEERFGELPKDLAWDLSSLI